MRARDADPVTPPVATRPEQVCALLADAISDGDLDAALGHCEPDAVVAPMPGVELSGTAEIRHTLASVVAARGYYRLTPHQVLAANGLALVTGRWLSVFAGPDDRVTRSAGGFSSMVRLSADGTWRIVAHTMESEPAGEIDTTPAQQAEYLPTDCRDDIA